MTFLGLLVQMHELLAVVVAKMNPHSSQTTPFTITNQQHEKYLYIF